MNIYVGNLSFEAMEDEVRQLFAAYGDVSSVNILTDKFSGRPRGFGFVEMPQQEQAQAAIQNLNGKEFMGRALTVNEARPKSDRPRGGGGGHGGHGGGGGRRRN
jgi:cold-inducible RNA-binding protein